MDFIENIGLFIVGDPWFSGFFGPLAVGLIFFFANHFSARLYSGAHVRKTITLRFVYEYAQKHIIEIKHSPTPISSGKTPPSSKSVGGDHSSLMQCLCVGVLFLSIFYGKNQSVFILAVMSISTFLLTILIATVFTSYRAGVIHGKVWKLYFIATFSLVILGYSLMYLALHPLYYPASVQSMAEALEGGGLSDLLVTYGIEGLGFLMLQTTGFFTLFVGQVIQLLSLSFYMSVTQIILSDRRRPVLELVAKMTKRFSRPYILAAVTILSYVTSAILISGLAYGWGWFNP